MSIFNRRNIPECLEYTRKIYSLSLFLFPSLCFFLFLSLSLSLFLSVVSCVVAAEEARLMSFRVETGHWERRLVGVLYELPTLPHFWPISGRIGRLYQENTPGFFYRQPWFQLILAGRPMIPLSSTSVVKNLFIASQIGLYYTRLLLPLLSFFSFFSQYICFFFRTTSKLVQ